jgi:hypothetical protein
MIAAAELSVNGSRELAEAFDHDDPSTKMIEFRGRLEF